MILWPDEGHHWEWWMVAINLAFYMILTIILLYLFLSVKYRVSHPFWSRQPVFHHLNLSWWGDPPGIIQRSVASVSATSYFDPWSTRVYEIGTGWDGCGGGSGSGNGSSTLSTTAPSNSVLFGFNSQIIQQSWETERALRHAWHLIRGHYLRHPGLAEYTPPWKQFISHCMSHTSPCHISLYFKPVTAYNSDMVAKGSLAIRYDKPVSCMMTRPARCLFLREKAVSTERQINRAALPVGYVDFLCTHEDYRKQSITPKLIYTHYKTLRDKTGSGTATDQCVFLFKREGELAPFVPLLVYNSFLFDTLYWPSAGARRDIEATVINAENFPLFIKALNHIEGDSRNLDIHIQADVANIKEQIAVGLLLPVVFLRKTDSLAPFVGVMILRRSGTTFRTAGLLELIGVYMTDYDNRTEEQRAWFAALVRDVCVHLTHANQCRYLLIEDMGHTEEVLSALHGKFTPQFKSPTAYYFYNYATHPVDRHRTWILL